MPLHPPITYPQARRSDVVDDYHGVKVADPFRWLEDPDSAETRAWVEAQNVVTQGWLAEVPARARIKSRLTEIWNYEKHGLPFREGDRWFWYRNDGLEPQSILYTAASPAGPGQVLIDPNLLSADGTIALGGISISPDGKLVAYGLAGAGSDWHEWRVRDIATGEDLKDRLKWIKFTSVAWTKDSAGFFYSRYPETDAASVLGAPNFHQKLFYHRLGTPQSEDVLIHDQPDQKEWGFHGTVTDDGRYLLITVWKGTDHSNLVYVRDLRAPEEPLLRLVDDFEADFSFVDNDGPVFWFKTTLSASRGRLLEIDLRRPGRQDWKELIPESAETLLGVGMVDDRFILEFLKDARSEVRVCGRDGALVHNLRLPGLGTVGGFGGKRTDTETFYGFTGYTVPGSIYRLDVRTGESTPFWKANVAFASTEYETQQVFATSPDGTRVPMFLSHRKGLKLDGTNPVYLYGYGGFNIPVTPAFTPAAAIWMEMGGVFAVANLRGGGEYGETWHRAGTRLQKQNVFDDFFACAEWLLANKYTTRERLAIAGRSNGGLLVGAALTQRPELFGAALPTVGVMDMLRFQKFTIGWAWVDDYGSSDNPAEFPALFAYSPLHNLRPGTAYPPTMIATADHDDRVVPAHSFKFAATMQAAQGGPAPVLIRIESRAGHGMGKPTAKLIDEAADGWAFLVRALGMTV